MKARKEEQEMSNESRLVRVETVIEHIQYMLDRIDKRFDLADEKIDKRFDAFEEKIEKRFIAFEEKMDKGFTGANQRMDKMDIKIDSNFRWVIGTIITLFVLNGFVPVLSKLLSNLIQ